MTFTGYKQAKNPHSDEYLEELVTNCNSGQHQEDVDDLRLAGDSELVVNNEYEINTCYSAVISGISQVGGSVQLAENEFLKSVDVDADLKEDYPELYQ